MTGELGIVLDTTLVEAKVAICVHKLVGNHNIHPKRVVDIMENYLTHLRKTLSDDSESTT